VAVDEASAQIGRRLLFAILGFCLVSFLSRDTFATSCTGAEPTVDQILEYDVIFMARTLSIGRQVRPIACVARLFSTLLGQRSTVGECTPCVFTIRAGERFKGAVPEVVPVVFDGAYQCPRIDDLTEFGIRGDLLVFAYKSDEGDLAIGPCWGVAPFDSLPDQVSELRRRRQLDRE
jgi:hypothetical protein